MDRGEDWIKLLTKRGRTIQTMYGGEMDPESSKAALDYLLSFSCDRDLPVFDRAGLATVLRSLKTLVACRARRLAVNSHGYIQTDKWAFPLIQHLLDASDDGKVHFCFQRVPVVTCSQISAGAMVFFDLNYIGTGTYIQRNMFPVFFDDKDGSVRGMCVYLREGFTGNSVIYNSTIEAYFSRYIADILYQLRFDLRKHALRQFRCKLISKYGAKTHDVTHCITLDFFITQ